MITRRRFLQLIGLSMATQMCLPATHPIDHATNAWVPSPEPTPLSMPEQPLTLVPPRIVSRVGVHVIPGPRTGFGTFVQQCAAAGRPVAVVKCVGDFGAAYDAKNASLLTLTIGRIETVSNINMRAWEPPGHNPPPGTNYTNAQEAAQQYYNLVKPIWKLNPKIDVWETFNEYSGDWGWQADFYISLMDLAEADGFRLGLWSASVGNPPDDTTYSDIARACQRARQHGQHILCLHEYGGIDPKNPSGLLKDAGPWLVTRYRMLYAYLSQQAAVIPLVISECGQNGGGQIVSQADFLADYTWYDDQLLRDGYVIGCAAWTLGADATNFQAYLPALTNYIINKVRYYQYLPFVTNGSG